MKERSGLQVFLLRARPGLPPGILRQRLEREANARMLAVIAGGSVLIAEFDQGLRAAVAHWPEVQLVGGINFSGRKVRRIRVDQQGRTLPLAPAA